MTNFLIGLIIIIAGAAFTWKSNWILKTFGRTSWAEKHLGGGSRIFYKLMGIAIIFLGFFVISGISKSLVQGFMNMLQMGR
ncbi:MAG TPA: hypothetical protein VJ900_01580 [Patescibacteria group bacterium]|nr:hypothetical protein [Patescibacteria group bacterium]